MSFLSNLFKAKTPEEEAQIKKQKDAGECIKALKDMTSKEIVINVEYYKNIIPIQQLLIEGNSPPDTYIIIKGRLYGTDTYEDFISKIKKDFENNAHKDVLVQYIQNYIHSYIHYYWKYQYVSKGLINDIRIIWSDIRLLEGNIRSCMKTVRNQDSVSMIKLLADLRKKNDFIQFENAADKVMKYMAGIMAILRDKKSKLESTGDWEFVSDLIDAVPKYWNTFDKSLTDGMLNAAEELPLLTPETEKLLNESAPSDKWRRGIDYFLDMYNTRYVNRIKHMRNYLSQYLAAVKKFDEYKQSLKKYSIELDKYTDFDDLQKHVKNIVINKIVADFSKEVGSVSGGGEYDNISIISIVIFVIVILAVVMLLYVIYTEIFGDTKKQTTCGPTFDGEPTWEAF
jgi:hypothetical protein